MFTSLARRIMDFLAVRNCLSKLQMEYNNYYSFNFLSSRFILQSIIFLKILWKRAKRGTVVPNNTSVLRNEIFTKNFPNNTYFRFIFINVRIMCVDYTINTF